MNIGFSGRVTESKGIRVYLTAARLVHAVRESHFLIAGPCRNEALLANLPAYIEYRGNLAEADLPAFYHSLDALVVPSIWPEAYPRSAVEARFYGVPVVGSRQGGIMDIANVCFETGDPFDCASKICAVLAGARNEPVLLPLPMTSSYIFGLTLSVYRKAIRQYENRLCG